MWYGSFVVSHVSCVVCHVSCALCCIPCVVCSLYFLSPVVFATLSSNIQAEEHVGKFQADVVSLEKELKAVNNELKATRAQNAQLRDRQKRGSQHSHLRLDV